LFNDVSWRSDVSADRIEREVLIEAPVDVVWSVITDPSHLTQWWSEQAELDLRPGGAGEFEFINRQGERVTAPLRVEAVEAGRRFAYRWSHPEGEEPRDGNSALVEFELEAEGDATRLRVSESGIADLPHAEPYHQDHSEGWSGFMVKIDEYARGLVAAGTR
jgi:uncharacterized protein YndB with AHSA1/START domain